jgi:AcrR family transcriptional regulator
MVYKINTVYKMSQTSAHISHKRLKRKEEILSRALQMVGESGLEALTMHRLAAELDLTAGALYRYFASKAEIISALERQVLRDLSDRLAQQLASPGLPRAPEDAALYRLWVCAQFYLRWSAERPEQAALIAMLLADPRHQVSDDDLPDVSADFIGIFGQLINQLALAQQCGALTAGDTRRRALVFWSSLQGVCSLGKLQRVDSDFFAPERAGAELVRTLLVGWGARAEQVDKQEQRSLSAATSSHAQPQKDN